MARSLDLPSDISMRDNRLAAAEREFVLDQILTDLWEGRLTPEAADRVVVELGKGSMIDYVFAQVQNLEDAASAEAQTLDSAILGERRYSCDYDSMRFGILDGSGNEILPAEALEITRLRENRYLLKLEKGLRVIDENADVLWEELQEE